jgi:RNase P/RNase MRP subunit p29
MLRRAQEDGKWREVIINIDGDTMIGQLEKKIKRKTGLNF